MPVMALGWLGIDDLCLKLFGVYRGDQKLSMYDIFTLHVAAFIDKIW